VCTQLQCTQHIKNSENLYVELSILILVVVEGRKKKTVAMLNFNSFINSFNITKGNFFRNFQEFQDLSGFLEFVGTLLEYSGIFREF
jgi:hypothetical protein